MKLARVIAVTFAAAFSFAAAAADLRVEFLPRFNGAPLEFDSLTNKTATGQRVSVTRLDFLVSKFGLHQTNGDWLEPNDFYAFINAREGKTSFTVDNAPAGTYDRLRFQIGLSPEINHRDNAQWPANHALNPDVNHLYWSWSKEYIFLAFEGGWQNGAKQSGFSFHLATDAQLMTVELPVQLELSGNRAVQVALDTGKIFSAPNKITLSDATDSSHSRTNDLLVGQLHVNVQNAFAVESVKSFSAMTELARATNHIDIAPNATPYRFSFAEYFPRPDLPRDNPLTVEGVSLGSELFFDTRLSADNSQSCATCHHPREAFTEPRRFSRGIGGEIGTRNAMPLQNLAWKTDFFWDGRAASLRDQVLQPIQNPIEMHETLDYLVKKISADTNYHRLFANAFGTPEVTTNRIARALEQFLLVQVSYNSKFDRVVAGREKFTEEEQRGFVLFHTEYDPYHGQNGADCFHCHGGPLFQSQSYGNNGLDSEFTDLGRYTVTHREGDKGKFAVPSLRNVAVTAPYMHDGRFKTLEEVIEHYSTGMKRSVTLDPNLAKHPDGGVPLTQADKKALVAFLKTLTDDKFVVTNAPAIASAP